jgi:hypothetical protein
MRVSDAWSQDAVLKAMCDDIARHANGACQLISFCHGRLSLVGARRRIQVDSVKQEVRCSDIHLGRRIASPKNRRQAASIKHPGKKVAQNEKKPDHAAFRIA